MKNIDSLNENKILNSIETLFIGKKFVILPSVDSTNNYAFNLVRNTVSSKNLDEVSKINGTVIIAQTQTAGRGMHERKWFSPPGGLWFSIILSPGALIKNVSGITIISAASIAEVLNDYYKISVNIKWPNDVYYKGKKLAGILTESENLNNIIYLVIGIGINVNNCVKTNYDLAENAISIIEILGKKIDRNDLLSKILSCFEEKYSFFLNTSDFKKIYNGIESIMIY